LTIGRVPVIVHGPQRPCRRSPRRD
jgi:hypothetical protein